MGRTPKFEHGIMKGLEKLQKWYMAANQSDMFFMCLGELRLSVSGNLHLLLTLSPALAPTIKVEKTKQQWEEFSHDKQMVAPEVKV